MNVDRSFRSDDPLILSEIIVDRLCGTVAMKSVTDNSGNERREITRTCRNQSYTCFYGRNVAEGFHVVDAQGGKIPLTLPSADILPQFSQVHHGEVPPLFLSTANVSEEFYAFLRKEGLTVGGKQLDFSNLPPSKITDPSAHLAKFIFIDAQSTTDMGSFAGNGRALHGISEAYGSRKFLWEPRGFYDANPRKHEKGEDDLPSYAVDRTSEMVSVDELLAKAANAAEINSRMTSYCEPTFRRELLQKRRNEENCFRVTELGIPRGCEVTVLARPVKDAAGNVRLVAPNSAEDGADVDHPDAQRYRFRIMKGHTVDNILRQRSLNMMAYKGFAILGASITAWAAADYPGLGVFV